MFWRHTNRRHHGCSCHDTRDYEFAKKFELEIIPVLEGGNVEVEAYTEDGLHITPIS